MNRREALQAGLGILTAVGIDGEVATVTAVNPQAFVITTPGPMSMAHSEAIRKQWHELFKASPYKNVPVLLMQNGMKLSVVDQKKIRDEASEKALNGNT